GDRTGDDAKNHAEDDRQHPDKGSRVSWPSVQGSRDQRSRSRVSWDHSERGCCLFKAAAVNRGVSANNARGENQPDWLDTCRCNGRTSQVARSPQLLPVNFDIERGKRRVLVVRILFADDTMADMFERDFGGR